MKPVCFMVMPFRTKPVTNAKPGAPKELDCDRLWDAAIRPALEDLNYLPVRADTDSGSVIVKDMLNLPGPTAVNAYRKWLSDWRCHSP